MFRPGALRWDVTIATGQKQVQLPTGFAYQGDEVVTLNERQVEQLTDDAFPDVLASIEPHPFVNVGSREYFVAEAELTGIAVTGDPANGEIDLDDPDNVQLTATASYSGDVPDRDVTELAEWSSDDETVAVVDADGLVTVVEGAEATDEAIITASYNGEEDTFTITIVDSGA